MPYRPISIPPSVAKRAFGAFLAAALLTAIGARAAAEPIKVGFTEQIERTFFTADDELTGNEVRSISVSPSGEVFLATDGGLSQFDGTRWSRFTEEEGLSSNDMTFFEAYTPGKLTAWVLGTAKGVQIIIPTLSNAENMKKTQWLKEERLVDIFTGTPIGYAISKSKIFLSNSNKACEGPDCWTEIAAPAIGALQTALKDRSGTTWVGGASGLAKSKDDGRNWEIVKQSQDGLLSADVRDIFEDRDGGVWFATSKGLNLIEAGGEWKQITGKKGGLPVEDLTCVVVKEGEVWVGSTMGLARHKKGADRWEYYQGRRWLPDDHVLSIGIEDAGYAWIGTKGGASRLDLKSILLERKSDRFIERLQARHTRYGLVSSCIMDKPGAVETCTQYTNDNDGLWTSMYIAAESFRFGATGDPGAKSNARHSLEALMRLESITPMSGFPARSIVKIDETTGGHGEWHETDDGKWKWKGDTSSDETDGHFFAYGVYYDLVAEEDEKAEIKSVVARIMDHIIDNGYNLIDVDGKPTLWGRWSEEYFNGEGLFQRGLNSLEILSYLQTAYHITGKQKYLDEYRKLADKQNYKKAAVGAKIPFPAYNHSDDELAYLVFYPILKYEKDPEYRKYYLEGLENIWEITQNDKSPLWNFIYASAETGKDARLKDAVETLVEIPMDTVHYGCKNSERADLYLYKASGIPSEPKPHYNLSWRNKTMFKWNDDPYGLDFRGDERHEDDGTFWLLPYWMGRYYGFIED